MRKLINQFQLLLTIYLTFTNLKDCPLIFYSMSMIGNVSRSKDNKISSSKYSLFSL